MSISFPHQNLVSFLFICRIVLCSPKETLPNRPLVSLQRSHPVVMFLEQKLKASLFHTRKNLIHRGKTPTLILSKMQLHLLSTEVVFFSLQMEAYHYFGQTLQNLSPLRPKTLRKVEFLFVQCLISQVKFQGFYLFRCWRTHLGLLNLTFRTLEHCLILSRLLAVSTLKNTTASFRSAQRIRYQWKPCRRLDFS